MKRISRERCATLENLGEIESRDIEQSGEVSLTSCVVDHLLSLSLLALGKQLIKISISHRIINCQADSTFAIVNSLVEERPKQAHNELMIHSNGVRMNGKS